MADAIDEHQKKAVALFREGRFGESTEILIGLNAEHGDNSQRCFMIGRNFLSQHQIGEAESWFKKCVEIAPHIWGYYNLALLEQQRGDIPAAGRWLLLGLDCGKGDAEARGYKDAQRKAVLDIGHAAYATEPVLALGIYRKAAAMGVSDYKSALRIVGGLINLKELDEATDRMKALRAEYALDGEGQLCLSRLHELRGKPDRAIAAVKGAISKTPDDAGILLSGAERLIELEAPSDAEEVLQSLKGHVRELDGRETARLLDLEFRLARRAKDPMRLATVFADFEFSIHGELVPDEVLEIAKEVAAYLEKNFSGQAVEIDGLLRFYTRTRMEPEALALLSRIKSQEIFSDPLVALRRLELYCTLGDLNQAEEIYEKAFRGRALTPRESAAAVRFLAERKRWDDAAAILKDTLDNGRRLSGLPSQLLRVARRASMREEMLGILDRIIHTGEARVHPSTLGFRQLLIDDLCSSAGADTIENIAAPGEVHRISEANVFLSSQELGAGIPLKGRTALFLCTDRAYFFGVLTFLASYAAHNVVYAGKVKLFVFLSEDVPAGWDDMLRDFSAKIGQPVQVLRETVFDTTNRTDHGSWGFFSGGGGLSRAAYFRLYAARYLLNLGEFDRLCYTDSDIICNGDLGGLLAYEMEGNLLGARCEEMRAETSHAADFNSIDREAYFNSGVLLFDLTKPELPPYLNRAIELGEQESHRLFFLDQCALNIAFENRTSRLPPAFNTFIRPEQPGEVDVGPAKLVHFISGPKPWDISYGREHRALWRRHAEVVRLLLARDDYRQVARAANGDQVAGAGEDSAPASELAGEHPAGQEAAAGPAEAAVETAEAGPALETRTITLADGRVVSTQVAVRPGEPALFVLGIRKSGSSILSQITEALAIHNGVNFVDTAKIFFSQNIMEKSWIRDTAVSGLLAEGNLYGVFRGMPFAFASHDLFISGKKILLVRDPRDALVSQHFSNAFTHPIPEAGQQGDEVTRLMTEKRELALSISLEESVTRAAPNMNHTLMNYAAVRDDPNTLFLKYEDVILQKAQLIEMMCSHFGWHITPEALAAILSWADVIPEQENEKAFVRKVIPGDHREKLSEETIAKLNKSLRPGMELFGYAAN